IRSKPTAQRRRSRRRLYIWGGTRYDKYMAALDWSQCPAVESIPGKRSGAWVFRDTRTPVSVVFDNLEVGASISEIMGWFHLSHEQVVSVIEFAARSLAASVPPSPTKTVDAHPL